MIKYEFKSNFKSLLLWTCSMVFLYIIVFIFYKDFISAENVNLLNDVIKSFPPELLKVFNMDIASLERVSGWFYTEGFVLHTIIGSIYAAILGSTMLTHEEDEKTIEYLYSKPISKNKIITNKIIVAIANIVFFNTVIMLVNLLGLYFSADLEITKFIVVSTYQLFTFIPIFAITLFISTFFRRTKKTTILGITFVLVSYFLKVIGDLSTKTKIFTYFSTFTLSSFRDYIQTLQFDWLLFIIASLITGLFLGLTYYNYNRKEFL